jgi:protein SCO1/2
MRATLAFLVLFAFACDAMHAEPALGVGGDFTLTSHDGRRLSLHDLRGKRVLLFFGYTHCPDACPTMLSKISRVYRTAGAAKKDLVTLFVSIDPDRDSPAALKEYLGYFASVNAIGLTGSKSELDKVVKAYGARYAIEPSASAAGPSVSHSTYLYVIDREGKTRKLFTHESTPDEIAAYVKTL